MSRRLALDLDGLAMDSDGRLFPARTGLGDWVTWIVNTLAAAVVPGVLWVAYQHFGGPRTAVDWAVTGVSVALVAGAGGYVLVRSVRISRATARRLAGGYGLAPAPAAEVQMCESCRSQPVQLVLRFADGARFAVCESCVPEAPFTVEGVA